MPRVTMSTLARELGVSKNTVSLALRHDPQIPVATRQRVLAAAKRLGYALHPVVSHLMAQLRQSHAGAPRHTLALLNANRSRDAFRTHPTVPAYVEGVKRRAALLGYGVDNFWLHDPELDGTRLNRILRARGIRGLVVVGMMDENHLPERFVTTWNQHACVVTGLRTHEPTLSFCCVDHHALVMQAVEHALVLGYKRPGLVIDGRIDRLVEGRFSAGMWGGQQALPQAQRVETFFDLEAARAEPKLFHEWLARERPDVVFTLYNVVRRWIEAAGLRVPDDIGLIQLERRRGNLDWAGMDQHNDLTGEAAVDMLVGMLHSNELGLPAHPRATLISGSWVDGATVRRQEPAARRTGKR